MDEQEQIQEIKSKLGDRRRRLTSGFYKIQDKVTGDIIPYIPNKRQIQLYDDMEKYDKIIILKARQLGMSTAVDIYILDYLLFSRGKKFGIVADNQDNAVGIYRDKIMIPRSQLPTRLKSYYKVKTERANEISFENTLSMLNVRHIYRSTTLSMLHISEFGRICAVDPQNAQEIITGSIETVALGNKVIIESTARGPEGYFYDMCKKAKDIQEQGREANQMERHLMFLPRHIDPNYSFHNANINIYPEEEEYFEKLELKENIKLTQGQKNWYVMKKREKEDDMLREYPSTFDEAFNNVIEGSYFEKELLRARQSNRITQVPYRHNLPVHVSFDLSGGGGGDDTTVRFFQVYDGCVYFIDYREGNMYSLQEVLTIIISEKKYTIGTYIMPHDVKQHNGVQPRLAMCHEMGIYPEVAELSLVSEGIQLIRKHFFSFYFDEKKCKKGIDRLSTYRRAFDEKNQRRLDRPYHNDASHCADSMRYACWWLDRLQQESKTNTRTTVHDNIFNPM